MKRCGKCGNENSDDMRFCLECGNQFPDAPFVVDIQGDTAQKQADLKTDNFGQSVNTQVGSSGGQYAPPNYTSAANRPRRSNTKIYLAVGGVVALLLLLFAAVGAVVVYNMMSDETVYVKPTPSPDGNRPVVKDSPSPEDSATPKTSPTRSSKTPTLPEEDDPDVTVKFDGIDVDYNVTENGKSGMRMTINFTVTGLKEKDSYLAIHFQTRDGDPLPANPGDYRDVKGNLAVFQTLKPDYDETLYKDLKLFLPYDEIDLSAGRHELKMDVDLLDGKGVSIEHLAYNDFWYEQK
ncbi:hypothetical protein BH20ACI4_BH20ACI4_35200 [soil metagenome]